MSKKPSAFGPIADLLSKFQVRLDQSTKDTREAHAKIALLSSNVRHGAEALINVSSKAMDAHRMSMDALLDIEKQKGTNKEVTESLYKLRESVQKSFEAVRNDMTQLLASQQRLNERLSKLESQVTYNAQSQQINQYNDLAQRVSVLENVIRAAKTLLGFVSKV